MNKNISRRNFLGKAAAAGAAGAVLPSLMNACAPGDRMKEVTVPEFLDQAPDGPELKAGLIGCGGRGTGAAHDFLRSGPNVRITALGDVLADRLNSCRESILGRGNEVADENCFVGFDAYQKVIDSGVDIIILATPPFFRPDHFAAAVEARKHIFMEKPVAVDPAGARSIMANAKKADSMGLCVGTGTQRRHQRDYVSVYANIAAGAIGEIVSANCYWNGGKLWHVNPESNWSEMEAMIRNWVNWTWLSGDHIVEQHVHNIDVINWYTGAHPVKAVGFGSRQRRVTGDQYDNFSVDFVMENGVHVHSMCRQINGCADNVSEFVMGTMGSSNCSNIITDLAGNELYSYQYPLDEEGNPTGNPKVSPYIQEHIDLVTAIRTSNPYNEAEGTAISTMVAIMGRISAYTGKETTWDEMMNSDLKLGPKVFEFGPVDVPKDVPIPGDAYTGE
jgi:predicted dehydrogenase